MKRDMDLIREILLEVEQIQAMQMWCSKPLLGHDDSEVCAHIRLATDAGLVQASFMTGPSAVIQRITNTGYDFLEASKQRTLWEQAKVLLISNGLPITIGAIMHVLETLINDGISKLHLN